MIQALDIIGERLTQLNLAFNRFFGSSESILMLCVSFKQRHFNAAFCTFI